MTTQPRPQGAFPGLWRWGAPPPKPEKRALGTRVLTTEKKKSLIKHFMYLSKREKAPNFFPDLNSIFQMLFRGVKLLSTANFKTLSRI